MASYSKRLCLMFARQSPGQAAALLCWEPGYAHRSGDEECDGREVVWGVHDGFQQFTARLARKAIWRE